jgi:hypothetical protein
VAIAWAASQDLLRLVLVARAASLVLTSAGRRIVTVSVWVMVMARSIVYTLYTIDRACREYGEVEVCEGGGCGDRASGAVYDRDVDTESKVVRTIPVMKKRNSGLSEFLFYCYVFRGLATCL